MYQKAYLWYENNLKEWVHSSSQQDMSWPYSDFLPHLKPKAIILDLGCGCGRDLVHFIERGFSAEGLDGSIKLCGEATERSSAPVKCQDFNQLDLPSNYYDGIFANAVLMHVEPQNRIKFLKQIWQSLKPGGVFYAHYPKGQKSEIISDGRLLHLTDLWPTLCSNFLWQQELNEGRPAFLSPKDQNWQVIRYRKSSFYD